VRDLARQLGKEVAPRAAGTETAVDWDTSPPRMRRWATCAQRPDHALRPEDRDAAWQRPVRAVCDLRRAPGGALVIHVEDDGRGIDAERVRSRATTNGLVDATMAASLTPDEVLEFLFLPGFSTAGQVTDVSGRGVGLDVVQAMVHASGGSVRVSTVPGEGTTFSLHLPVTRSVLRCLLIVIGGEPFGLPLSHVDRLVRVRPDELLTVEGRACVRVDEETVGIVPAAQVLAV
jgi:two-component system sensor histidine kinase and response regulator WspE